MNTQNEISVLADQALDAVIGGRMNMPHPNDGPQHGVAGTSPAGYAIGAGVLFAVIGFSVGFVFL